MAIIIKITTPVRTETVSVSASQVWIQDILTCDQETRWRDGVEDTKTGGTVCRDWLVTR